MVDLNEAVEVLVDDELQGVFSVKLMFTRKFLELYLNKQDSCHSRAFGTKEPGIPL
ncbi:MAG: hypothetical protein LBD88_00275 [Candidatus Peribacteria bacterium]|nr:hypothetical protein [Candidatus Peribacteria bacterium]